MTDEGLGNHWRARIRYPDGSAMVIVALEGCCDGYDLSVASGVVAALASQAAAVPLDEWHRDDEGGALTYSIGVVAGMGDARLWPSLLRDLAAAIGAGDARPGRGLPGEGPWCFVARPLVSGVGGEA